MSLNINPKVIAGTAGALAGAVLSAGIGAVIHQCGGGAAVWSAASDAVLPVLGAAVAGYLKSQGNWSPQPPAPVKP